MPEIEITAQDCLHYEYTAPENGAATFVFVNALTGNTGHWEAVVAPALRELHFGTLSWNFRGQDRSEFAPDLLLTPDLISADLELLVRTIDPPYPVPVGLSIGGLFAAHSILAGLPASALVLLNTMREIGPRIGWINEALPRLVGHGGVGLFMDAVLPLLVNPDFTKAARQNAFATQYQPMHPDHGHMNLMRNASSADWSIDWSRLDIPVHIITGMHDRVFLDMEVVDRQFATLRKGTREDWSDAGHLLPLERPEKLAASLAAFAARIGLST